MSLKIDLHTWLPPSHQITSGNSLESWTVPCSTAKSIHPYGAHTAKHHSPSLSSSSIPSTTFQDAVTRGVWLGMVRSGKGSPWVGSVATCSSITSP